MNYNLKPLDEKLVYKFFWRFSTLECALKRAGFLQPCEDAKPNWDTFSKKIKGHLSAKQYSELLKSPPKKQINSSGVLAWKDQPQDPSESDERYLMRMLCSVRNNLFHGGKYPDGPVEETERNFTLIKAALEVVEDCLKIITATEKQKV